jgi:hypothetical protein
VLVLVLAPWCLQVPRYLLGGEASGAICGLVVGGKGHRAPRGPAQPVPAVGVRQDLLQGVRRKLYTPGDRFEGFASGRSWSLGGNLTPGSI